MLKKLDILIIRSFVGPFIITFFIALFVLVMQFFWLYMDELLGKGFGVFTMMKLLFLMSSTMVPMALPLGILLASIMTFGNMGEAYELVAIKSAGISLWRFLRPLLGFISLIGIGAFFFNNNVIPVANLKALSLLYDLRNAKMTFNIRPGQFNNDLPGFAIKIGSQDKNGKTIRDIIIYEGGTYSGNDKILMAKSGEMTPSADGKFLIFRLRDGWRYQEGSDQSLPSYGTHATQTRMHFKQYDRLIDLSVLKLRRTDEGLFKDGYQMMNVEQLLRDMKKIRTNKERELASSEMNFVPYLPAYDKELRGVQFRQRLEKIDSIGTVNKAAVYAAAISDSLHNQAVEVALSNVRNAKQLIGYTVKNADLQDQNLIKRAVAFHGKFTLSFACVLLFLIGAPLGAIIRKGGLGMPVVVAIAFFVIYFLISDIGKNLSESGVLRPYIGMWMSTAMLLPIALFMIRQARNDAPVFSKEWYLRRWNRIREFFRPRTKTA